MKIVQPTVTNNLHEKQINQTVSHFFPLQENNEIHLLYTIKAYTTILPKKRAHFSFSSTERKKISSQQKKTKYIIEG